MSERLYFIFGLPAFEIELKNRKLMEKNLAAISPSFRNSQTSWRDLYKSRRDLGNLSEMKDISPRSLQDLQSRKHHDEISTNLGEISVISTRWRRSHHDLAEI